MAVIVPWLAAIVAFASALSFYAGSTQCRVAMLRRLRFARAIGTLLALASIALWIVALGTGAGIAAAFASWMLAAVAIPYSVWMHAPHAATDRR
jgi:hypothetical protein